MRLLFVNYEFPPVGGGAAYASLALAREFVRLGHEIDFLTSGATGAGNFQELDGVRVHRVPSHRRGVHHSGLFGALTFVARSAAPLRALARRNGYDAYLYYFSLPTAVLSLVPGPHRRSPSLVSLRGSDVPGYDPALNLLHRLLQPLTRRIWRRATRVVANSEALRSLALASIPGTPIEVIANGAIPNARPARRRSESGVRILTVSRLIARKGLDTLILALSGLRGANWTLDIAGEGPARADLMQLAASHGAADRVRFLGFVENARLESLYAQTDIFVLASVAESCSMALLEAMAAGLPVIATRVGGNVELIEDGYNGLLVAPGSVAELGAALRMLIAEPTQCERLAEGNCRRIRERYSWSAIARQYEALFTRMIRGETAPEPDSEAPAQQMPARSA